MTRSPQAGTVRSAGDAGSGWVAFAGACGGEDSLRG